jgi:hypothetical protein
MAVTAHIETVSARSVSVAVNEGFRYTRSFTVQVDDPATPLLAILNAPGIGLWAEHPENANSKAQKFDAKPRGSSLLLYEVTIEYDKAPPQDENRPEQPPGGGGGSGNWPRPIWSGGTRAEKEPFKADVNNVFVSNSAGVPFPDAEREVYHPTLSVSMPVLDFAAAIAAQKAIVGKVNAAGWAGGGAKTWLCTSGSWQHKTEDIGGGSLRYVECQFEFAYKPLGWFIKLLDVGYQQLADQDGNPQAGGFFLTPIKGADKKPVKEPVALDNGLEMQPPPSKIRPPHIVNEPDGLQPYQTGDFALVVGNPN